jgi:Tfp pilus assembly protein PilO
VSLNNRVIAAVLAVVALSGAFYMFALKPKREEASSLKAGIATQQAALDTARQLLATNTKARTEYRGAYSAVVRLGKAVPADDDVQSLMVQVDSAAKAAGVDFRSIDVGGGASAPAVDGSAAVQLPPGATVGPAGFPIMPFSFAFTGTFDNLGDFFRRIEGFVSERRQKLAVKGRLLTLEGLQLKPDTEGFPHIRATVTATSYLTSPLEGATAGATAAGPAGATAAATGTTTTPPTGAGGVAAPSTATSTGAIR